MNENYELAQRFYNFILKYTDFMEKNKDYFKTLLTDRELEIETSLYLLDKENRNPWKKLPKGKEIEKISEIITSDYKEFINYVRLTDILGEQLYLFLKGEQRQHFKEKNNEFDELKYEIDFDKYKSSEKLSNKLFSEQIIELHKLYKEIVVLSDAWISIRRENVYKNYKQQVKKIITDFDYEIEK